MTVTLAAEGIAVNIGRAADGSIEIHEKDATGRWLGDGSCGTTRPTVFDTDSIHVITQHESGGVEIEVSTRNGGLAPGASSEPAGAPEIETRLEFARTAGNEFLSLTGSLDAASDTIVFGTDGIAFNRDDDADVTYDEFRAGMISASGYSGDDLISGGGGFGTGNPYEGRSEFSGDAGNDVLEAAAGHTLLSGDTGSDVLRGSTGNDTLRGGVGGDVLDGGTGRDRSTYYETNEGVEVNLAAGTSTGGEAAGDMILNVEDLEGTRYPDRLTGDAGPNLLIGGVGYDYLYGLEGDDVLRGGAHQFQPTYFPFDVPGDVIDGGPGRDASSYADSRYAVQVNLATGEATGDSAQRDELHSIEDLFGSSHADTLIGNENPNRLAGGWGDDRIEGAGNADEIDGEYGADVIDGGEGDDQEVGGSGNDRHLQGAQPNGADILSGGEGDDDEVDYTRRTSPVVYSRDPRLTTARAASGTTSGPMWNGSPGPRRLRRSPCPPRRHLPRPPLHQRQVQPPARARVRPLVPPRALHPARAPPQRHRPRGPSRLQRSSHMRAQCRCRCADTCWRAVRSERSLTGTQLVRLASR